jgi:hypothetical protein
MDKFWGNLLHLSDQVPMFPHPLDLLSAACKVQRDSDLSIVAANITQSPYPRSILLRTEAELERSCGDTGVVVKRDFSDSATCTFMPGRDRVQAVTRKEAETDILYSGIQGIPRPRWMAQPFNLDLAHKGELRAYVVGGVFQYSVHTWFQGSTVQHEFVDNYTPLDLLL